MIIAIDFKVDNERAVQFRKWANQIVKYINILGRKTKWIFKIMESWSLKR